jgi:uncharacterized protein with HEPN domain
MRAALSDIRELTAGDKNSFKADRHTRQAVAYNLAVLGEAARSRSPELRERYPNVPWLDMIDTRNVAVHEYHRLDSDILWTTATENLPPLDQQLAAIEEAERTRSTRDPGN